MKSDLSGDPMANHMRITLIFDAGKEVTFDDLDVMTDGIIDLMTEKFPGHSGTCMTCCPADENGDPIKK